MQEIRLNIPDGCKAVTVKVDGDKVITEFEPRKSEWKPEDGDILTDDSSLLSLIGGKTIVIYKDGGIVSYAGTEGIFTTTETDIGWGYTKDFRPATKKEKAKLLAKLESKGYRWNAEKKELEKIPRWRAKKDEEYFFISEDSLEVNSENEAFDEIDDSHYNSCNYFKTREAAERVVRQIREIFKDSKPE